MKTKLTIPPPTVFKSTMNIGWITQQAAMRNQMPRVNAVIKDLKVYDEKATYFEDLDEHILMLLNLQVNDGDWRAESSALFACCIEMALKRQRYPFMNNTFTHKELKEWRS